MTRHICCDRCYDSVELVKDVLTPEGWMPWKFKEKFYDLCPRCEASRDDVLYICEEDKQEKLEEWMANKGERNV